MKKFFNAFFGMYCLLAICGVSVYAESHPDAGTLLRETEKQGVEVKEEGEVLYAPAEAKKVNKGEILYIKSFKFAGAKVLPEAELKRLLKDFIGRYVDVAELDVITGMVAEYYAKKGYIVKVIVPEQEIKSGIVEIKIVKGHLEGIKTTGKKKRFNQKIAIRIVTGAQNMGTIIRTDKLERGMLILNDVPGVQARALLGSGTKEGGVAIDLHVKDTPLVGGSVGYDNYGLHSTGTNRGVVGVHFNDPFGIGDQINGSFIYTGLMYYGSLAYSLPVGYSGMRAGLSTSYLGYKLGKEFSDVQGRGKAFTVGPYVSYPLIRSRSKNMYVLMSFHHKKFTNETSGITNSDKKADVGNVYINADAYDRFLSGGYTMGSVGFSLGGLNLKGNPDDYFHDSHGLQTHGIYSKLTFLVSRIQRVTDKTSLNLKVAGQFAFHNLDSSEQFSLGGPDGVRAYAPGDVYGDHGFVATAELSRKLRGGFKIEGFYDLGYTVQCFRTYAGWESVKRQKESYGLDAVGASLSWNPKNWFSAKVSVATAAALRNYDINKTRDFRGGIGKYSRILLQVTATL